MNDHSAGYAELPRTAYLDHTLRRARTAAEQRSHRYVTLEHLLLALLDDPDAVKLLRVVGADIAVIQSTVGDAVNNRMGSLAVPDGRPPSFSYKFDTLFLGASEDAVRIGCPSIDGALALVAIAKDPDSNASAILAANGFSPSAALHSLSSSARLPSGSAPSPSRAQGTRAESTAEPPRYSQGHDNRIHETGAQGSRPSVASQAASLTSGEASMEEMLLSVRNILEAEERKERGLPPASNAPAPAPARGAQPRFEPQLRPDGGMDRQPPRSPVDLGPPGYQGQDRIEPSLGKTQPPQGRQPAGGLYGYGGGLSEPSPPALGLDDEHLGALPIKEKRSNARHAKNGRGRAETPSLVAKVLEHIPRKTRVGVAQAIQLRLSKEEAGIVFGRPARQSLQRHGGETQAAYRAVTVRLSAPEGGFFIEAAAPETQWIFDRPSFLGEEAFGTWAWTLIPNENGSYPLAFWLSARDVDENGLAGDINLPEQVISVRVRGNFWRGLGRFVRTVLLLLAGSGLTVGAYYALKMMGKIPH
jgi:hypothetical protein